MSAYWHGCIGFTYLHMLSHQALLRLKSCMFCTLEAVFGALMASCKRR